MTRMTPCGAVVETMAAYGADETHHAVIAVGGEPAHCG